MTNIKQNSWKNHEIAGLLIVYLTLVINAVVFQDNIIAVLSAFFGITYTILAGKGYPVCYIFGVSGSGLYSWLSFTQAFWGNLVLYLLYYIPMQILGFFKWNKNLKKNKNEIVKTNLNKNEFIKILIITSIISLFTILVLYYIHDKNPIIDGITTVFSLAGMYLTVRRCIEQWQIWMLVNGLSAIMWIDAAIGGAKVYSTVTMWIIYFILSIYFYFDWKKELAKN